MKAFIAGLLFLIAVLLLSGVGVLLFPLLVVMGFFLRLIIGAVLIVLAIWLLGKFIIFVWEAIRER